MTSIKKHLLCLILLSSIVSAQLSGQDSIWAPMQFFLGSWRGEGSGVPGKGEYTRSYRNVLGNKFIEASNTAVYSPSEKKPNGETHTDLGYISYDNNAKTFRLRQFHVEGFVNQYRLDSISADRSLWVFVTESIENIPPGWRARESYRIVNDNEFEETFELAAPGKEFFIYTRVRFRRQPSSP